MNSDHNTNHPKNEHKQEKSQNTNNYYHIFKINYSNNDCYKYAGQPKQPL